VWFANTGLSSDMAPNDVHDTDKVLWIAVDGAAFTGKTPNGIGIGSNRTMVQAAAPQGYGNSPRNVPITSGAGAGGSLDLYYKTGFIAAYDANGNITTFTVFHSYPVPPDGSLDAMGARIPFMAGELDGSVFSLTNGQNGTSLRDVKNLLGAPDGDGNVMLGNQQLHLLSYGFIGLEVFALPNGIYANQVLMISVHAPYYGTFNGSATVGVGSARTDVEAALGNPTSMNSANTQNLVCYDYGGARMVGVTYSTDNPPAATTITLALPQCP
jgi:hypothetical protein